MESGLTELPEDVGVCEINKSGEIIRMEKEFYRQGRIFKSWDAFYNHPDAPCYVSESGDKAWTRKGFLELCNNQEEFAQAIFDWVDWQRPETVVDELLHAGKWSWCPECEKFVDLGSGVKEGCVDGLIPKKIVDEVLQRLTKAGTDAIDWKINERFNIYIEKQDILVLEKMGMVETIIVELRESETENTTIEKYVYLDGGKEKVRKQLLGAVKYILGFAQEENAERYQAKEILRRLHVAGGCSADKESWSDGWDTAITEAISIVEDVTEVSVMEALD